MRARAAAEADEQRAPLGALALLLLALLAWAAAIGWQEHRLRVELAALPAAARHQLFAHTVAELRGVCSVEPQPLEHCRHQAELALRLAECDGECRALAERLLGYARR